MRSTRVPHQLTSIGLAVAVLITTVITLLWGESSATARQQCAPVNGHFETTQIELDGNPNTLEFMGPLNGGIQGDFVSTELVLIPGRPETPSVFLFTERLDITTKQREQIRTIGTGSFNVASGLFTEILTVIERKGVAGEFGEIFLFGVFDASVNHGSGDYRGELCS